MSGPYDEDSASIPYESTAKKKHAFAIPAPVPFGTLARQAGRGAPTNSGGAFEAPNNKGVACGAPSTRGGFESPITGVGSRSSSNTGGGFGAPSTFGLLGPTSSKCNTGNVFGEPTTSAFGAPIPTTFGAPPGLCVDPVSVPFRGFCAGRVPAPAWGLFGSGGLFGPSDPTTGGWFGAPVPATGGFLFGASVSEFLGSHQHHQQGHGSTVAPYQVATRQVGATSSINFQSISAMMQFEGLRHGDNISGSKGKGDAMVAGGGGFVALLNPHKPRLTEMSDFLPETYKACEDIIYKKIIENYLKEIDPSKEEEKMERSIHELNNPFEKCNTYEVRNVDMLLEKYKGRDQAIFKKIDGNYQAKGVSIGYPTSNGRFDRGEGGLPALSNSNSFHLGAPQPQDHTGDSLEPEHILFQNFLSVDLEPGVMPETDSEHRARLKVFIFAAVREDLTESEGA